MIKEARIILDKNRDLEGKARIKYNAILAAEIAKAIKVTDRKYTLERTSKQQRLEINRAKLQALQG